jgi:hypothetical protein
MKEWQPGRLRLRVTVRLRNKVTRADEGFVRVISIVLIPEFPMSGRSLQGVQTGMGQGLDYSRIPFGYDGRTAVMRQMQ